MNARFLVLLLPLALAACGSPLGPLSSSAPAASVPGTTVAWTAPGTGGDRTVVPTFTAPATYTVTLTPQGGGAAVVQPGLVGTSWNFGALEAGTYTVVVDGLDAGGNIIASGSGTVAGAADSSVTVMLSYLIYGPGTGTIDLVYDYSASGHAVSSAPTARLVDPSGAASSVVLEADGAGKWRWRNAAAALGSWTVFVAAASADGTTAYSNEAVTVMRGLSSAKTLAFAAGDFTASYVRAASVVLSAASCTLGVGQSRVLSAVVYGADGITPASNQLVSWYDGGSAWADVAGGTVTVPSVVSSAQSATVSAVSADNAAASASCAVAIPTISVAAGQATLLLGFGGASRTLSATVSNAADAGLSWSSANASIASVNASTGVVTPGAVKGSAVVTAASTKDPTRTAAVNVSVGARLNKLIGDGANRTQNDLGLNWWLRGAYSVVYYSPLDCLFISEFDYNDVLCYYLSSKQTGVLAGTGTGGFNGDGNGASTQLNHPWGLAVGGTYLYVADFSNCRIRMINPNNTITTTVAGGGASALVNGVSALSASLPSPVCLAWDGYNGQLLIGFNDNTLWRLASGYLYRVAGVSWNAGYNGDGIAASGAHLDPEALAVDSSGNFYVADQSNNRVRRIDRATGLISTVAGTGAGTAASGDGGSATAAVVPQPCALTLDASSNLYIGSRESKSVRRVTGGFISTVVGGGTDSAAAAENGAALSVSAVIQPCGIALKGTGYLFYADLWSTVEQVTF